MAEGAAVSGLRGLAARALVIEAMSQDAKAFNAATRTRLAQSLRVPEASLGMQSLTKFFEERVPLASRSKSACKA